jgi:hypothetical protein
LILSLTKTILLILIYTTSDDFLGYSMLLNRTIKQRISTSKTLM